MLKNVGANLGGKVWALLISLAAVPLYIRLLGMEQYGLLGIFLTLTAIFAILDLGLGNALNRQLAQYSVQPGKEQDAHDLLRTLESIYWLVGIVIGVVTVIAAPLIAEHWVRANTLTTERVSQSLAMMGIAIAVQWPRALYTGGLQGIQQQVLLSVVAAVSSTVLAVGGVLTRPEDWAVRGRSDSSARPRPRS